MCCVLISLTIAFSRRAVGLLVGNSRAIWPHFLSYLRHNPSAIDREPLQEYSIDLVQAACIQHLQSSPPSSSSSLSSPALPLEIRWAHTMTIPGLVTPDQSNIYINHINNQDLDLVCLCTFSLCMNVIFMCVYGMWCGVLVPDCYIGGHTEARS